MKPVYLFISRHECEDGEIVLSGATYHHLVRVKRVGAGAPLRAALPDGRILHAEVSLISAETLRAHITGEEAPTGISPCRITLYQAVLKGEKMELVVQKATELGVSVLAPLLTQHSIPRWTPLQARERAERWQRIADAAAEQCERSIPMRVEQPQPFAQSLTALPPLTLLLHERAGESLQALATRLPDAGEVGLYLGPEGGWEEEEVRRCLTAGAVPIHLGRRILRAETASIAAITLTQFLWGDLRASLERE